MLGGPQPARGLVGQGHGGLVVALALGQRQRPKKAALKATRQGFSAEFRQAALVRAK
jgi:hypothetical protein